MDNIYELSNDFELLCGRFLKVASTMVNNKSAYENLVKNTRVLFSEINGKYLEILNYYDSYKLMYFNKKKNIYLDLINLMDFILNEDTSKNDVRNYLAAFAMKIDILSREKDMMKAA